MGRTVSGALALEQLADRGQILVRQPIALKLAPAFESRPLTEPAGEPLGEVFNIVRKSREDLPERPEGLTQTMLDPDL